MRELRDQVRELQTAVAAMRSDWQRSRAESVELRRQLDEIRNNTPEREAMLRPAAASSTSTNLGGNAALTQDPRPGYATPVEEEEQKQGKREHAASLEEEYQLLSGKVDDQYQTKV